jgi:hypothetical protein
MNMKKTIVMLMVVLSTILCMVPATFGVTTVTGTFTPIPTGVSIACNKTAPGFGNIALGSNAENISFNVTNEGDVNCSVKMTAGDGAGTWALVAGTTSPATTNQYCVNMNPNLTGYVDVFTEKTVSLDIPPSGNTWNYTRFDLKVFVSDYTNEGTPAQQTFYANLTAAALS